MEGLWLVPTPIGNLGDITLRAIEVLGASDLILAEDTRTTAKLLKHYDINTPMRSFHMHNEHKSVPRIVSELTAGGCIALVSDAGSPGVSDPGFLLVRACLAADIHVEALPGATALIPALTLSGLPSDRFVAKVMVFHRVLKVLGDSPHSVQRRLAKLKLKFYLSMGSKSDGFP